MSPQFIELEKRTEFQYLILYFSVFENKLLTSTISVFVSSSIAISVRFSGNTDPRLL